MKDILINLYIGIIVYFIIAGIFIGMYTLLPFLFKMEQFTLYNKIKDHMVKILDIISISVGILAINELVIFLIIKIFL